MREWVSVSRELPQRNLTVYAKDNDGHIFEAIYFGPVIGWVNLEKRVPAYVKYWAECM